MSFAKSGDGYTGTFDSDALQVTAIPFGEVKLAGSKVHFTLPGDATTAVFEGSLTKNSLSGSFKDGPTPGTFRLKRSEALARLDTPR